jgi:hypothetical protein
MRYPRTLLSLAVLLLPLGPSAPAADIAVDYEAVTKIRDEGMSRSQVMETVAHLTEVIGPRLTGSPAMRKANDWTKERLSSFGLQNARLESWGPFGRGWSFDQSSVRMVAPLASPLLALPKAWTPGTSGPVRGKALRAKIETEEDMEKWRGKLAGALVLLSAPRDLPAPDKALFSRFSDDQLHDLERFAIPRAGEDPERRPGQPPVDRETQRRRYLFSQKLREYLLAEKAAAAIEISERDGAVIWVTGGGSRYPDENPGVPSLVMAAEHYNRICRLLDKKVEVELEVDVRAQFHDGDQTAWNTLAEIPGTDKNPEVVMIGAHLDSWHAGTGATDNAAGSATAMEAVRILQALGVKPKRTIRIALWSGEEQGLLGSRAYVSQHFASRPEPTDPKEARLPRFLRPERGPLTLKPEHARLYAYFNLDNGTGKIRGIYTQQNAGAAPIFEAWLKPFADLGARAVTQRSTSGTDHLAFDRVGLPGFQFIQDQADYPTRTHHTNLDVYDRIQREDLIQASIVMASFVYHAAMREGPFPRKALPKDPPAPTTTPADAAPAAAP